MTLTIRPVTVGDAPVLREIYAPYVETTVVSFEEAVPSVAEMSDRIVRTSAVYPWLVAEDKGWVVGYAYASQHRSREAYRWSVDVGIYVRMGLARRGIGRALYTPLIARLQDLRYANAFAGIALPNDASVALHEAFGFTPIGVYRGVGYKHGAWRDVGWWQLTLSRPIPPPEPLR